MNAKLPIRGLFLLMTSVQSAFAQAKPQGTAMTSTSSAEQEMIKLSQDKWRWMAERNVEALDKLFVEEAIFVHMGGTMSITSTLRDLLRHPAFAGFAHLLLPSTRQHSSQK